MPVIKHFYQQFGDAHSDLAKRIKHISDQLQLINQLIAHGKSFASVDKAEIANQINAFNEAIRGCDFGIDSNEIGERIAQFNLHSLKVLEMLDSLDTLPDLEAESQALEETTDDFNQFEQKLSQDPGRKEMMVALNTSSKMLEETSSQLEATRDNPLVAIAQCWFEGAEMVQRLQKTNKPTIY